MSDVQTALAIGAMVAIPVTVVGNLIAIHFGTYLRNVKARRIERNRRYV